MEAKNVGVVGCGLMGAGIAQVFAQAGAEVRVLETDALAAHRGEDRIEGSFERAVTSGRMGSAEVSRTLDRISVGWDIEALAQADLVIEAANEDVDLKLDLFRRLDNVLETPGAVLASNTSSVPIMKLGSVTSRPEQVIGMHFFNPVPVLPLVEIVPSLLTSVEIEARVEQIATDLGKTVIRSRDRAGFVVNALLVPYLLAAIRMVESGFASAADVDAAMVQGCAHPMGPLHLTDLIGTDTVAAIATSMYAEFKEPLYAPPPLLLRMMEAGLLGRKSGRGFFEYAA